MAFLQNIYFLAVIIFNFFFILLFHVLNSSTAQKSAAFQGNCPCPRLMHFKGQSLLQKETTTSSRGQWTWSTGSSLCCYFSSVRGMLMTSRCGTTIAKKKKKKKNLHLILSLSLVGLAN